MNRRAFLATLSTLAVAGCAARLGLVDRVTVAEKYVHVAEDEDEDEDDYVELVTRRYDPESGPAYDGEIHDVLADDLEPDGPLTISQEATGRLESSFEVVRYGMRACESLEAEGDESEDEDEEEGESEDEDAGSGCRDTWLFLDDFNDLEVGDVVDVRYGDDVSGIVSIED